MVTHMAIAQIQPNRMGEFIATWERSVLPELKKLSGLKNYYILTDKEKNSAIGMAIYDSPADVDRLHSSGDYQRLFAVLASCFVPSSVERKVFDVSLVI